MNRRTLTRASALCVTLALAACASPPPKEMSILDAMAAQSMNSAQSCSAINAATVCVKSSRFSKTKNCGCVDRRELMSGSLYGF